MLLLEAPEAFGLGLGFSFAAPFVEGVIAPGGTLVVVVAGEPGREGAEEHEQRHGDGGEEARVHRGFECRARRAMAPVGRAEVHGSFTMRGMRTWTCVDGRWVEGERPGGPWWFDLSGEDREALLGLAERFGLHPLAVEDCLAPHLHAPKIDDFGSYAFVVALGLRAGTVEPVFEELDVFLGREFLITYRDDAAALPEVDAVRAALEQGVALRPGTDGLLYEVLDRVVDTFLPRVAAMNEELDRLADLVIEGDRDGGIAQRVLEARRAAGTMRRTLAPMLSLVLRFGRGEVALVQPQHVIYFRDIYDHLLRVDLALEELREDAEVALSTYLSTLNNKMNEVMKVLAVVGALALPATVITGVFGTNFDEIPGLHSNYGFAVMVASMLAIAGSMAWLFHRRGWF